MKKSFGARLYNWIATHPAIVIGLEILLGALIILAVAFKAASTADTVSTGTTLSRREKKAIVKALVKAEGEKKVLEKKLDSTRVSTAKHDALAQYHAHLDSTYYARYEKAPADMASLTDSQIASYLSSYKPKPLPKDSL